MFQTYTQQNRVFFYSLMVILAGLSLWLISGYLDIIVFSLVMVVILKPVYNYFERLFRGRAGLATTATLGGYDLFGFFGVVYGPVLMVLAVTTIEVYGDYYADRRPAAATPEDEARALEPNANETPAANQTTSPDYHSAAEG